MGIGSFIIGTAEIISIRTTSTCVVVLLTVVRRVSVRTGVSTRASRDIKALITATVHTAWARVALVAELLALIALRLGAGMNQAMVRATSCKSTGHVNPSNEEEVTSTADIQFVSTMMRMMNITNPYFGRAIKGRRDCRPRAEAKQRPNYPQGVSETL